MADVLRGSLAGDAQAPPFVPGFILGYGSQDLNFGGAAFTLPPLSGESVWLAEFVKEARGGFSEDFLDNEALFDEGQHGLLVVTLRGPRRLAPLIREVAEQLLHVAEYLRIKGVQTWSKAQVVTDAVGDQIRLFVPFTKGIPVLALIAAAIAASVLITTLVAGWKLMRLTPQEATEAIARAGSKVIQPITDISEGIKSLAEDVGEGTQEFLKKAGLALIIAAAAAATIFILNRKAA